jgi:hypothetical protein
MNRTKAWVGDGERILAPEPAWARLMGQHENAP